MNAAHSERIATTSDIPWVRTLYETLLRKCITQQWGWDGDYQDKLFDNDLQVSRFRIVSLNGTDVAAYIVNQEPDHLYLKMLLVARDFQHKGIGSALILEQISKAKHQNLPVRLSVIKANPVSEFYTRLGFVKTGEHDGSIQFEYTP